MSRRFLKLERPSPKVLKEFKTELFPNLNIPNNNFYLKWGYILNSKNSQLQIKNVNHIITITKVSTYVNEIVFRDINTDEILVSFKDISLNGSHVNFTREINKMTYKFVNGIVTHKTEDTDFKFLSKANQSKSAFTKFITWDIETRTIDNKMVPYCICVG